VIEAAGNVAAVELTPLLVRKAGKVALVGEFEGNMNFGNADETCFFTTFISPIEYPIAIDLLSRKKVNVEDLVTHKFKIKDFVKAIKTADDPAEKPVKVLINA
jgi:L-iditol 2-dehydrogenase